MDSSSVLHLVDPSGQPRPIVVSHPSAVPNMPERAPSAQSLPASVAATVQSHPPAQDLPGLAVNRSDSNAFVAHEADCGHHSLSVDPVIKENGRILHEIGLKRNVIKIDTPTCISIDGAVKLAQMMSS